MQMPGIIDNWLIKKFTGKARRIERLRYDFFLIDIPHDLLRELLLQKDIFLRVKLVLGHGIFTEIAGFIELAAPDHAAEAGRTTPFELRSLAEF